MPHPTPRLTALVIIGLMFACNLPADEPPVINPFGPRTSTRDDAIPGYVEMSDGVVSPGQLYLTRDARLKIFDMEQDRQRDVPLSAIQRIDCAVEKEWNEKEWRFKENANDQKVFTGRSYPVREYIHTITLLDGRTIQGPLSAILYVEGEPGSDPARFLLHKRDKGAVGADLPALRYVRRICLGDKALEEGKQKASKIRPEKPTQPSIVISH
jgi:hypothetical protein